MNTATEIVSPMVELDAREFGLHLKEGGWRLALLVARSVEPGEGEGAHREYHPGSIDQGAKVSASWFADHSGTSHNRVMRYYRAWERVAAKGRVPHAADLALGAEPDIAWERLPRWSLSELPSDSGATGPLNLAIKLGQFGDRLLRSHKRFITFVERDLPEFRGKPGKPTRELAGRYADCLETEAQLLRRIAAGESLPSVEELREQLKLANYFETA